MRLKLLFAALLCGTCAGAPESTTTADFSSRTMGKKSLNLEMGYHNSGSQKDSLSQSAIYHHSFASWISGELGLRLNETFVALQSLHYKFEPIVHPLSFVDTSIRLVTSGYHVEDMGATVLLFRARLHAKPFHWLELYGGGGYFERFIRLEGFPIFVNFSRDVPDNGFAGQVGTQVRVTEKWTAGAEIATFDAIQVFNLHNPFLRVAASFQPSPQEWKASLFARYRILLGFGRLDELVVGAGLELPLTPP